MSLFQNVIYRRTRKRLEKCLFSIQIFSYFKMSYTGAREKARKDVLMIKYALISKCHIQARAKKRGGRRVCLLVGSPRGKGVIKSHSTPPTRGRCFKAYSRVGSSRRGDHDWAGGWVGRVFFV